MTIRRQVLQLYKTHKYYFVQIPVHFFSELIPSRPDFTTNYNSWLLELCTLIFENLCEPIEIPNTKLKMYRTYLKLRGRGLDNDPSRNECSLSSLKQSESRRIRTNKDTWYIARGTYCKVQKISYITIVTDILKG